MCQLSSVRNSTCEVLSATPKAVKDVKDVAIQIGKDSGLGDIAKDISNTNLNNLDTTGFYKCLNLINASLTSASIVWGIINIKVSTTGTTQLAFLVNGGIISP